jgi:hypothetical protein
MAMAMPAMFHMACLSPLLPSPATTTVPFRATSPYCNRLHTPLPEKRPTVARQARAQDGQAMPMASRARTRALTGHLSPRHLAQRLDPLFAR